MRRILKGLVVILGAVALGVMGISVSSAVARNQAGAAVVAMAVTQPARLPGFGSTQGLSVLPLMESVTARADLQALPGVSYLVRTDQATVLLDLGPGVRGAPLPSMSNLAKLGLSTDEIDMIVISHSHFDHTGATSVLSRDVDLGRPPVNLAGRTLYAPRPMLAGKLPVVIADAPRVLAPGVATLGALPFVESGGMELFGPAANAEQVLAVNVAGKGVVLIIGCGHPGIERILLRAQAVLDQPVIGIIGGLHYRDTDATLLAPQVALLKMLDPQVVALSPHDSFAPALTLFRDVFGAAYRDVAVGSEIRVQ